MRRNFPKIWPGIIHNKNRRNFVKSTYTLSYPHCPHKDRKAAIGFCRKIETTVLCNCHKSDKSVENDRKKK